MAVEAVVSMAAVARIAAALEDPAKAAPMASDLMAEAATVEAADRKQGAIRAHRRCGRQNVVRSIAVLRIFVPPSTIASGIRSATPPVPRGPMKDAVPQVPGAPPS